MKSFEMYNNSIKKGDRVLIVDEWIETGGQVRAVIELIEKQGGLVVGISSINVDVNDNTKILFDKYNCKPIRAHTKNKLLSS
jgi:adenine phosphoribosyltransferase